MILVDTSIWGRIAVKRDPLHATAVNALQWIIRHDRPAIAAQSLYEFWGVATRPLDKNGLGWQPARAASWIRACRRSCLFLPDDPRLFDVWSALVESHATKGKPAHDARLVASMMLHGIHDILTFNPGDFTRYAITVRDPLKLSGN
jgi:predicted nucleic acid-binding protein